MIIIVGAGLAGLILRTLSQLIHWEKDQSAYC